MSSTTKPIPPRLIDLMVEHATQGLSPQDEAELQAALASDEAIAAEAQAYALAAAAVELSLTTPQQVEALPAVLRERLIASAPKVATISPAPPPLTLRGTAADTRGPQSAFSFTDGKMFGWYAAIAAMIALLLVLVGPNTATNTTTGPGDGVANAQPTYDELLAAADTVTANWGFNAQGGDERFANCTGQVIWNTELQAGYMKLAGLPVNDPTKEQYQLWIVDPARDEEPIDGGVFNITAQGEIIVPIDAKLRSENPAVFAITVEQPGGVVVSEGPLQVVAAVQKS